jgi:hypothetical protein
MKSTNKTQERASRANVNYKAKFAGEVLVTPLAFNPTGEEIKQFKKITKEDITIDTPSYKKTLRLYEDGQPVEKEYNVVSLLCSFTPNELLKVKGMYSEEMYVNYELIVSPEYVKGSKSGKYQIIDDHNQNAWIKIKAKQTIHDAVLEAKDSTETNQYDAVHKIDPKTARVACVGEVALYELLFNMSTCDKHDPDKNQELSGFLITEKPTEVFKAICAGDVSQLNKYLLNFNSIKCEEKEFFVTNGKQNLLGLFMGVSTNRDKNKLYQTVYSPQTEKNISTPSTFRPTSVSRTLNTYKNLGDTRLPKELVDHLMDNKYPWAAEWGCTFKFKEITFDDIASNETSIVSEDEDFDGGFPF